jgi:predicted transcriptional regulator
MSLIGLTNAGKKRARDVSRSNIEFAFLNVILENGPSTLEEIQTALSSTRDRVAQVAKQLAEKGMIKNEL